MFFCIINIVKIPPPSQRLEGRLFGKKRTNMNISRNNLKFIIQNVDNFMAPEFLYSSNENKFLFMYLHSMVGRYETNSIYHFKALKQKHIRLLTQLESGLINIFPLLC